ncbi:MAG TPA: glycosyl hydrolase [Kiritimatiellia bacterium]|nr:glycosyl hydrolase [Kiritimatiellia bacterium]
MHIRNPNPRALAQKISNLWNHSAQKIQTLEKSWKPADGSPVFTVRGRYTSKGWTEWTQGFQFGMAILQYDATDEAPFLEIGRRQTLARMAPHLTHTGVHDHGFNNVSTYGNLWRLMNEGRIPENEWERHFYELALKASGAVQASRWTPLPDGLGYIYSFNGPHSLFVDTIRSLRALALSHKLGHVLQAENDVRISLLERLKAHARATARYSVWYGEGRDAYDLRGRTAHEAIFNVNDGAFRCPNSQQGFSPFTTWTRGLAWAMCGFAEELEFLQAIGDGEATAELLKAAAATCDFYIDHATARDGVPYWDTGAPQLHRLGNWQAKPADPYNRWEPVDSSAAAIAAQGLMRLGRYLDTKKARGGRYTGGEYMRAGLSVLETLLEEPYLNTDRKHQGLLLHSVYHQPRGWDYIPKGRHVPCGESSMWGDYHLMEAALLAQRILRGEPYHTFFHDPRNAS